MAWPKNKVSKPASYRNIIMANENDYKLEKFEDYYGDIIQVKKIINECNVCGAKVIFSHLSDYKNLIVEESAKCPECGNGRSKLIHIIN
jgi:hypothetical protein